MIKILLYIIPFSIFISCGTAKRINYSFQEAGVADSIIYQLKKYEHIHQRSYQDTRWFAVVRESSGGFEIIISEQSGYKTNPFHILQKKTNRFLKIAGLTIPVLFDTDILSSEMSKANIGSVNWGGYYFKIEKQNHSFRVTATGVLF